MKKKICLLAVIGLALGLSGCVKDNAGKTGNDEPKGNVTLIGGFGPAVRTTLEDDTSGETVDVWWTPGDAVGVISTTQATLTANAKGVLMEGAGERYGKFSAMGVYMEDLANQYLLYYPYDKYALVDTDSQNESPVKVTFNSTDPLESEIFAALTASQTQKTPNDFSHMSKYGYAVAVSDPADEGEDIGFAMEHPLTYLELSLYATGEIAGYSVEEITVTASNQVDSPRKRLAGPFKSKFDGTYVGMDDQSDANFLSSVILTVENPAAISASNTAPDRFLLTMLPIDLTGQTINLVAKISKVLQSGVREVRFYNVTLDGTDFKSDNLYRIKANMGSWERLYPLKAAVIWEEDITLEDVDLVTVAPGTNIENDMANSFLLPTTGGQYYFPAKMPNGTQGVDWIDGIIPGEFDMVRFTVPPTPNGANALIGVYRENAEDPTGESNIILYSWHLWITDAGEVTIGGVTMLDRQLGATSATAGEANALPLYFQWGRKDPFPRAISLNSAYNGPQEESDSPNAFIRGTRETVLNTPVFGNRIKWNQLRSKQTYNNSYAVPTSFIDGTFIGYSAVQGGWLTEGHENLPSFNPNNTMEWPLHANPCPKGYRVASPEELQASFTDGSNKVYRTENNANVDTSDRGTIFTDKTNASQSTWAPNASYRNNEVGNFRGLGGQALTWANKTKVLSGVIGKYAYTTAWDGSYNSNNNGRISGGRAVRCVQNQ